MVVVKNYDALKGYLKNESHNLQCTLAILKINGFFNFVASHGVEVGDELTQKSIELLSKNINDDGEIFKINLDEFAILFKNTLPNQMIELAKQIQSFSLFEFLELSVGEVKIFFNIGISIGTGLQLIQNSTLALLEATKLGRNRYYYFDPKTSDEVVNRNKKSLYWQEKLKDALLMGKLFPFFQPIINNKNGLIERYESLIRLETENGMVLPLEFLGCAKESGLLSAVTRVVIAESFKLFRGSDISLSLNISEDDLADAGFVDFLKQKMSYFDIKPTNVAFEILEGIDSKTVSSSIDTLTKIKELGCLLVADDFGSEHSNFKRLSELHIDIIKIDGFFVKDMDTNSTNCEVVKAIVAFAKNINAKTVAEYVHSEKIFKMVKALEIDYSQGYFIGEPRSLNGGF